MSKKMSYNHILKYTGIFGSVQVINILTSVLRNKAAALLIDRYGQGVSELFNSTINLVSSATTLIIPVSIVRRISFIYERFDCCSTTIRHEIKIIRSWSVLTGLFGSILVILLSSLLSEITFDSTNHTRSYILLSPMVLMLSINGTEIAILKGTRQLKKLVSTSVAGSISTLIVCLLCYYIWNLGGIVVSLDVSLAIVTCLNLHCTIRQYPYKISPFCWRLLSKGKDLIKLSISFLLATLVASLSEMLIRTYISHSGSIENVGLYAAGFALTVTYTRFIFTAMDADYYPHLSGICNDTGLMNTAINRQIIVCTQLIVPCLLIFTLFLPTIISILYTSKYLEIVPMVICSSFYMYTKAIITPIAYTSLAKADSKMYLIVESISAVFLCVCVITGYKYLSLMGCGIGLTASNLLESILIVSIYRKRYHVNIKRNTIILILFQLAVLITGILAIAFMTEHVVIKYLTVLCAVLVSITSSIIILYKNRNKE